MIIGFSSTNKILSRIIKWATRSKASHAYVLIMVAGEPIVIHSNQHGVNCDHYNKFKKDKKIVSEYKLLLDEETEKQATANALRLLDKPYDFLSVLGFGWVLLCKALGCKAKNPFPNRSAYQCSEFALTVMRKAGIEGTDKLPKERVSPEDLIDCLEGSSQAKEI